MRGGLLSIGEISKFSNTSIMTLRYYDQIGIITPEYKDEQTGYRYYSTLQLERIAMVKSLKFMGMQLSEIKETMDNMNAEKYSRLMTERMNSIDARIAQLQSERRFISRWLSDTNEARNAPKGVCSLRTYPEIRGYFHPCHITDRFGLVAAMRDMEKALGGRVYAGRAFRMLSREGIEAQDYATYDGLFLPEWYMMEGAQQVNYVLPGGEYAVIYSSHLHEHTGRDWQMLLDFVRESGCSVVGSGYRYIPLEKGIADENDDYAARIAVMVSKQI